MNTYEKSRTIGALSAECTADYALADFEGDIKKILSASAKAVPAGHYPDGDVFRFGGIVVFDVLYVDAEGKLTPIHTTADYELTVPVKEESTKGAMATLGVVSVTARPSGPRRLGLRANLGGFADVLEEDSVPYSATEEFECQTGTFPVRSVKVLDTAEREYAEDTDPIPNLSEAEILLCGGDVFVERAEKTDDGVKTEGKIYLFSLLRGKDGNLFYVTKTVPFSELLRNGEAPKDAAVSVVGNLTSVTAAVTEEEENRVTFSCICEFSASAETNAEIPVTLDLYARDYETEMTCAEMKGERLLFSENTTQNVSGEVPIPDECKEMTEIFYQNASAKITESAILDNQIKIRGELTVGYVGESNAEGVKPCYCHGKITLPFEKDFAPILPSQNEKRVDAWCYPYRVDVKINGENLTVNADISLSVRVTENAKMTVVTSADVKTDLPVRHDKNRITVYYPDKSESVYAVAKRFHVSADALMSENGLAESVTTIGKTSLPKKLMIRG